MRQLGVGRPTQEIPWHEGFHVYGEHGSVVSKSINPWYFRSADVECFSTKDDAYHRPLGADSQFFRRQIEGLADTVLTGVPLQGADAEDGLSAMRVLAAISRSTETESPVRPLSGDECRPGGSGRPAP